MSNIVLSNVNIWASLDLKDIFNWKSEGEACSSIMCIINIWLYWLVFVYHHHHPILYAISKHFILIHFSYEYHVHNHIISHLLHISSLHTYPFLHTTPCTLVRHILFYMSRRTAQPNLPHIHFLYTIWPFAYPFLIINNFLHISNLCTQYAIKSISLLIFHTWWTFFVWYC